MIKRGIKARKAQAPAAGTAAVAVLIIVMLVFIMIYLLSLPPSERARLLNMTTPLLFLLKFRK